MTEPGARTLDVRVGSSTDALTPVSVAKRSLAARAPQWLGLSVVVLAAVAADQVTKLIVSDQLELDESDEFAASDMSVDADGTEHVHFQRTHLGLRVIGGMAILRREPDSQIRMIALTRPQRRG